MHVIILPFGYKIRRLKICLKVFAEISLLSLLLISRFNHIAHGEFANAYLFITPPAYVATEIGELFDIAINISSVENLRSIGFAVNYNMSLLNVEKIVNGSFFPAPPRSYFEFENNTSAGFVKVNMSLADSETPRNGNGTLAWISFKVVQGPELCVTSPLDLKQILLLNSALTPIAYDSVGAVYFWESLQPDPPAQGRTIDVYTQKAGVGADQPGGEFETGEIVHLISQVLYQGEAVQHKLVSFEVRNPLNETVLIRTGVTCEAGVSEISFTLPDILSSNGTWTAISVVEIAGETVWDTISFLVRLRVPVGGYSFPIKEYPIERLLTTYLAISAVLIAVFTIIKRRRFKRLGRCVSSTIFALMLFLLLSRFSMLPATSQEADIMITDLYSCDALGIPQDYFPKKTTAYFNITVRNLAHDPKSISIYLTIEDELSVPLGSDQLDTTVPPDVSTYYIMSVFIPKWAYVGVATAYASVFVGGIPVDSKSTSFYIGPEDLVPPSIHLLSPENSTYRTESTPLVFTVNERTSWIGYNLNHLKNVTIAGNTTLTGLTNGLYSIIVYANDTSGNVGASEEVYFTILVVHDIAIIDLKCSPEELYIGQIVDISAFVRNEGTVTESFNVTVYANNTAIETLAVTNLLSGNQTTVVITWNTSGFVKGNYTISAYVTPVLNEAEITDNTFKDGVVNVMRRPDIAVTNVEPLKTLVVQGYSMSINVTVKNQGDDTETFNVTAYANTTRIQTETVTLTSGKCITITFTWNTSGFVKGNYTLSAYVWPIPNETATEDNMCIGGAVLVTIAGDVNGDWRVDGKDIAMIAKCFNAVVGQPNYVPNADINNDGKIDGKEIALVSKYYGTHYP